MFSLALRSIRQRPGRFVATLLAAFLGAGIIMTFHSLHDTAGGGRGGGGSLSHQSLA